MRHVIVGNGVAGTAAASTIRKADPAGEITILSDEDCPFYSRIRLIDYLAGETDAQGLIIFNEEWYRRNGITLFLNTEVTEVDCRSKRVLCANGRQVDYDRLLIAAGSVPFRPPGLERPGVYTLRSLNDARWIRDQAARSGRVIILGGGVLGIEVGNALRKRGSRVSVVEVFPRLLPRQMDPEGSAILQATLQGFGLEFHLDAKAREIIGGEAVTGLLLEDGRLIEGDMVIISAGVRPSTALFEGTGVSLGRGVIVNDRMETSLSGVYAAGDLAEHRGVVYGIWPAAEQQGAVAGAAMAGQQASYSGTVISNTLKVAGVDLLSAGEIDAAGALDCLVEKDPGRGIYRKVVFKDDVLAGCILCGDLRGKGDLLSALQRGRPRYELQGLLKELGFSR